MLRFPKYQISARHGLAPGDRVRPLGDGGGDPAGSILLEGGRKPAMAVRLTANEQSADVVVRKGKYDYRIYPISDAALRWLKGHSPSATWSTISGQETITATRRETARLIADVRSNDFRVRGVLAW
jgi:hypothetical protein